MPPSEYFKRQCFASVEPDEAPARYVIEELGADQLVFSTDYPHGDARYPRAVETFLELPLTDENRRKILWDNCARFYSVAAAPHPLTVSLSNCEPELSRPSTSSGRAGS
jgi:predicted TIM-barrel fold metal-dependent hydrolase